MFNTGKAKAYGNRLIPQRLHPQRLHPQRLNPQRLRWGLLTLLLVILGPLIMLLMQTQEQMKWEAFYQHRLLAEELAQRIDQSLQQAIAREEAYGYGDYQFFVPSADLQASGVEQKTSLVQQSILAQYPVNSDLPGLLGYFQVDEKGVFSTPLLPDNRQLQGLNLAISNLQQRQQLRDNLLNILSKNKLIGEEEQEADRPTPVVTLPPAKTASAAEADQTFSFALPNRQSSRQKTDDSLPYSQQVFDELHQRRQEITPEQTLNEKTNRRSAGRVADLNISKEAYFKSKQADQKKELIARQNNKAKTSKRIGRKEQTVTIEAIAEEASTPPLIHIFASELDPFVMALLDSGEFVLFRKAWRDGKRFTQGAVIDRELLVQNTIARLFHTSALVKMSDLVVAYQGKVIATVTGQTLPSYTSGSLRQQFSRHSGELRGTLLHQTRLSDPLGELELLWTINNLPAGSGAQMINWSSFALCSLLVVGFLMIYWLGIKQIRLNQQQQDFVSAVSHELKTPLTSIRMYGEMLKEGWVTEEKKSVYYEFIHDESERLSRLIANILHLAKMDRHDFRLDLKPVSAGLLVDTISSKIHNQVSKAGFSCHYTIATECKAASVAVDLDAFSQIIINIVDNALKFAGKSAQKRIDINLSLSDENSLVVGIRDFGPGIPATQLNKIFDLFYRLGNELARDTTGTGIGLALVRQLSLAMHGKAEVINRHPGAEFFISLPLIKS